MRLFCIQIIIVKVGKMDSDSEQIEPFYEVEEILGVKVQQGQKMYQVKWTGYSQITWEPLSHLTNVKDMLLQFERKIRNQNQSHALTNRGYPPPKKLRRVRKTVEQKKGDVPMQRVRKVEEKNRQSDSEGQQEGVDATNEIGKEYENRKKDSRRGRMPESKDQFTPRPRVKISKWFPEEEEEREVRKRNISVYTHSISRVLRVEKQEGTWRALVQFEISPQSHVWIDKDLIRLLHPMPLIQFYQSLFHKSRNFV